MLKRLIFLPFIPYNSTDIAVARNVKKYEHLHESSWSYRWPRRGSQRPLATLASGQRREWQVLLCKALKKQSFMIKIITSVLYNMEIPY